MVKIPGLVSRRREDVGVRLLTRHRSRVPRRGELRGSCRSESRVFFPKPPPQREENEPLFRVE
jgi:hypothetical protein